MNKFSLILLLSTLVVANSPVNAGSEKIGNFALIDHEGNFHQLRKYGDSKAVVIISTAVDCQENIERLPKYRLLRTTWERQGVTFLAINSTARDSRADIRHMDDLYNFDLPILLDSSQLVAESLGLTRAGEIIVLAPDRFQVLYRGGLDIESRPARPERGVEGREGTSFLADTLQAVVAGATSFGETVTVAGEGC